MGYLSVTASSSLTSLNGLENLTVIGDELHLGGNRSLIDISALNNVRTLGGIIQFDKNSLSNCTFYALCERLAVGSESIRIYLNGQGCNSVEQVQANCGAIAITNPPPGLSTVCAGSNVMASVSTSGFATSYLWYKNGVTVPSQTSATLSLTNVQTGDAGNYVVVITSSTTSLTSSPFQLVVNSVDNPGLAVSGPLTCATTSVTLTASGGSTYSFNGPGLTQSGPSNRAAVSQPGMFSVIITSAGGCTASAFTTVVSNTDLQAPTLLTSATTTTIQPISVTASGLLQ
ncbi:immunoglobulin domain-containing protein [Spirosoma sp. BT702]|uniref:Immunoglobulin domain-containing protein n=1 Tax=Spirosoma profusum TaxID=2771354 RepID=A0A926Y301_9BACT|nr:immunoglobulin domain-containing protein [Spirosoma profusum]MBD2703562.1 immunoglobulin domain-containing protein [Spirosoma profusum]